MGIVRITTDNAVQAEATQAAAYHNDRLEEASTRKNAKTHAGNVL